MIPHVLLNGERASCPPAYSPNGNAFFNHWSVSTPNLPCKWSYPLVCSCLLASMTWPVECALVSNLLKNLKDSKMCHRTVSPTSSAPSDGVLYSWIPLAANFSWSYCSCPTEHIAMTRNVSGRWSINSPFIPPRRWNPSHAPYMATMSLNSEWNLSMSSSLVVNL